VNEPSWDPLVPPSLRVPLNLRLPDAPLAAPTPPVATATPRKVTVTGPLSLLAHPCCELDRVTVNMILLAPPAMLPFPPNGSHCWEASAEPLPFTLLAPKSEFLPKPVTEEIVAWPLLMRSEALPVYLLENVIFFVVGAA